MTYNGSGGWTKGEVWAGGTRLAVYVNGTTYFPITNQVGTERAGFGVSGGIAYTCKSQPFGDNRSCTDPTLYHFAKLQYDPETGNDHAMHRDFGTNPLRWLTPDPGGVKMVSLTDPQTWDLYVYSHDNPETLDDPTGLQTCSANGGDHTNTTNCSVQKKLTQSRQHKARVIYGETRGLSSEVGKNGKPARTRGAIPNLKMARENVADISVRNKGVYSRTPTAAELKNHQNRAAWQASQAAAAGSNGSLPGKYFFIRQEGVGKQRPSKRAGFGQGTPIKSYGPFKNAGGGDVPRGSRTYIDIYDK